MKKIPLNHLKRIYLLSFCKIKLLYPEKLFLHYFEVFAYSTLIHIVIDSVNVIRIDRSFGMNILQWNGVKIFLKTVLIDANTILLYGLSGITTPLFFVRN